MTNRLLILILFFVFLALAGFAQTTISGLVKDANNQPLPGANIVIKGKIAGTTADGEGKFKLIASLPTPFTLVITNVGYQRQEIEVTEATAELSLVMNESLEVMDEVVLSASRVDQSILKSPVSVEKMSQKDIANTASVTFYDGLENIKGLEMVTSGLTYRQINTRGFNDTGNARFLQLVDWVDNQTPGLGFAVGNLFGSSDIDMESAELIPGAASALYGPVAFNGVLMMKTKDPFKYQGLSAQAKVGVNHINEQYAEPSPLYDLSLRYAKAFNDKFAFKVNVGYFTGNDFYATNYTDIDEGTPEEERGDENPARNAVNIYGDEVVREIVGVGRVSRTGYEELDVTDYDVYSLKLNGALHYRVSDNMELIYQYNFGQGTANYTGSNRFSINNFTLQQHRLEIRGANYFLRAYSTAEMSNDSYNASGLGRLINQTWVRDLNGDIVPSDQADDMWFTRYEEAFQGNITNVSAGSHDDARAFADEGRFTPDSEEFEEQKQRLIGTQGMGGAGIYSNSKLYHAEGQYDFSDKIKVFNLLVGGNFRMYDMFTNGTLFDDVDQKILINEGGAFVQAGKGLFNESLQLSASLRYDKNQNFEGHFTPRASAVWEFAENQFLRTSYQTGFRNPTPGDQYINLNAGPITILGGVPENSEGLTVYENSFYASSLGPFFGAFGQAMGSGSSPEDAVMASKDQLVKSDVAYLKPEQAKVFEVGYRGLIGEHFSFDVNYYFNSYRDFLLNTVVIEPESDVLLPDGSVNPGAAADILQGNSHLYQLYTNAADKVTSQGSTIGLTYQFDRGYSLGGNLTYASLDLQEANPDEIPAFNTPKYRTSVLFGNDELTKNLGFNVAWRWQDTYDWYGTFTQMRPGTIEAYSIVDAQVSYKLRPLKSVVKLGAFNLFNNQVYQAYGSPSIGAIYYVSLTFDQLLK